MQGCENEVKTRRSCSKQQQSVAVKILKEMVVTLFSFGSVGEFSWGTLWGISNSIKDISPSLTSGKVSSNYFQRPIIQASPESTLKSGTSFSGS